MEQACFSFYNSGWLAEEAIAAKEKEEGKRLNKNE